MEGEVVAEEQDGGPGGEDEGCIDLEGVDVSFLFGFLQGGKVVGFWRDLQHEDPSRGC